MKSFSVKTFGCKTNQYESQAIKEQLLRAGFFESLDDRQADLFVVNTCTVTEEADRKCLSLIRRLKRNHPQARIAVTGCGVELNAKQFAETPGVSLIISNRDKDRIVERIMTHWSSDARLCEEVYPCLPSTGLSVKPRVAAWSPGPNAAHRGGLPERGRTVVAYSALAISYFAERTRAFVKIQDGCDHRCTYCKVVLARGPSRSRPFEDVVREVERLRDAGYKEIVLTGIQLGAYGDDWGKRVDLGGVLQRVSGVEGVERIRLSSIDPSDVGDELIQLLKENKKVCNHLHLPLQSGDDTILKRMKRAYRSEDYVALVDKLYGAIPDFALTTDVMVGFPGETEVHFESTLALLKRVRPLKLHVFPFSPREGTVAAGFPDPVPWEIVRRRVHDLITLGDELSLEFRKRFLGKEVEVLTERKGKGSDSAEFWEGHTRNYLKVLLPENPGGSGNLVHVRVKSLLQEGLLGEFLSN